MNYGPDPFGWLTKAISCASQKMSFYMEKQLDY